MLVNVIRLVFCAFVVCRLYVTSCRNTRAARKFVPVASCRFDKSEYFTFVLHYLLLAIGIQTRRRELARVLNSYSSRASTRKYVSLTFVLVRPGSLSPMLAAAASISNKSELFDPLSHTKFSAETSRDDRLPGRTSSR
jgi:hypothetical protein